MIPFCPEVVTDSQKTAVGCVRRWILKAMTGVNDVTKKKKRPKTRNQVQTGTKTGCRKFRTRRRKSECADATPPRMDPCCVVVPVAGVYSGAPLIKPNLPPRISFIDHAVPLYLVALETRADEGIIALVPNVGNWMRHCWVC